MKCVMVVAESHTNPHLMRPVLRSKTTNAQGGEVRKPELLSTNCFSTFQSMTRDSSRRQFMASAHSVHACWRRSFYQKPIQAVNADDRETCINRNHKTAFVGHTDAQQSVQSHKRARAQGDASRPHLDLLLQEVDFVLLLQKLLLLPGNLRTEHSACLERT